MAFHQYNKTQYNAAQYNADARLLVQSCTESIAFADARIDGPIKALAETITSVDALVKAATRSFTESLLLTDVVSKSVLNKGLAEVVRINDWLQILRKKDRSPWSS